jgi:hypothetical protein
MTLRTLALVLLALVHGTTAQAGPWLREKGSTFTSTSISSSLGRDANSSGYLEFGITPDTTVGLDLGFSQNRTGRKLAFGTLFIRRQLGGTAGPSRWAYELGIGGTYAGAAQPVEPHVKTGLSYGRGIQLAGKSGWLVTDAAVLWELEQDDHVTKIDTTLGLNFSDQFSGMVQLNFARQGSETFTFLEPSLVIAPFDTGLKIQAGIVAPLDEPDNSALKLGIWQEF